jgi:hypothetical protein
MWISICQAKQCWFCYPTILSIHVRLNVLQLFILKWNSEIDFSLTQTVFHKVCWSFIKAGICELRISLLMTDVQLSILQLCYRSIKKIKLHILQVPPPQGLWHFLNVSVGTKHIFENHCCRMIICSRHTSLWNTNISTCYRFSWSRKETPSYFKTCNWRLPASTTVSQTANWWKRNCLYQCM